MRKNDWWVDVMLFAALVVVLVALVLTTASMITHLIADKQVRELLEDAQARGDLYEMAQIPATERPSAGVILEPPEP